MDAYMYVTSARAEAHSTNPWRAPATVLEPSASTTRCQRPHGNYPCNLPPHASSSCAACATLDDIE